MKPLLLVTTLILTLPLIAHPDPRHTLEHLEEHLKETPDNPQLLAKKVELLMDTEHLDLARPVCDKLLAVAPGKREFLLLDAQVTLEERNTASALSKARAVAEANPDFAAGWRLLSRVEEESGNREAAIAAILHSLSVNPKPTPSDVLTCAAWLRERGKPGDVELAVTQIDQGLAKLGVLSGLHYQAIELELPLGHYESALRRIDALTARFRPSADLSLRRADILEKAGRHAEAAAACDSALALLDMLPANRKKAGTFQKRFNEIATRKEQNLAKK
ncbi:MAG: tetratricopeptide repeat protein [Verrucomicrobiota bacterium]